MQLRQAFRFLRWSRNAAASFHSMHMVVSIGRLRANVLERIALKCANALHALLTGRKVVLDSTEDSEQLKDASWPELVEELLLATTIAEPVAAASPI